MIRTPDIPDATREKMNRVFAAYPELTSVTLFGSRVTGKATPRLDFDPPPMELPTVTDWVAWCWNWKTWTYRSRATCRLTKTSSTHR